MDNYYNSYGLAVKLLEQKTYCTGTLRSNKKDNCKEVASVNLKRGENKSLFLNGVHIGKWRDKRNILYISTEFGSSMDNVTTKRGEVKLKPTAIIQYNNFMSGVDLQDQMLAYYPCNRKTLRWYKMFIHVLQMSLVNSLSLYNKFSGKKLSVYDFRMAIIQSLLPEKLAQKRTFVHRLSKITNTKKRQKREKGVMKTVTEVIRKDCKVCRRRKIRTATVYECKSCDGSPGYCVECFFDEH